MAARSGRPRPPHAPSQQELARRPSLASSPWAWSALELGSSLHRALPQRLPKIQASSLAIEEFHHPSWTAASWANWVCSGPSTRARFSRTDLIVWTKVGPEQRFGSTWCRSCCWSPCLNSSRSASFPTASSELKPRSGWIACDHSATRSNRVCATSTLEDEDRYAPSNEHRNHQRAWGSLCWPPSRRTRQQIAVEWRGHSVWAETSQDPVEQDLVDLDGGVGRCGTSQHGLECRVGESTSCVCVPPCTVVLPVVASIEMAT